MTVAALEAGGRRRWLPWVGGFVGVAALAWVLRGFDLDRFLTILAGADLRFLALVPLAIMGEQLVRAWKWRQLLHPLRPRIGTLPLFGTIMAGYLLAMLVPFGFGTVARSWLVARREGVKLAAVLATAALDRLTDGVVFACLVPVALLSVAFADPTGGIRAGLVWGAAGSFVLFALLLLALAGYRHGVLHPDGRLLRLANRLPSRFADPVRRLAAAFAEGIAWPGESWRGIGIVVASVAIKLFAATHFLWAGLAVGVLLRPGQYLFLIVFLGFLIILGHFARVVGSFVIGAVFALGLFGVGEERALAMVLIVEAANLLSVAGVGALSLWRQGSPSRSCARPEVMMAAAVAAEPMRRFRRIAAAGVFFQGGAAAVDTSTIVAALVHGLTGGSAVAVGAAAAIARYGWLAPQLFVGYLAQRRERRLPFYMLGAFGRVACLAVVAGLVAVAGDRSGFWVTATFFTLWTVYAFVSGIVAVPYNDIVGRAIASEERSRMLAVRFFGGGLLALAVAGAADRLLDALPFPEGFAAVLLLGTILLLVSALSFVSAGEPQAPPPPADTEGFLVFLRAGVGVVRTDRRFRLFLYTQWLGGAVAMALPFYVLQVTAAQVSASHVAFLLGAQTAGALLSNPLWGWWGDVRGKRSLLEVVAAMGALAPLLTLAWITAGGFGATALLPWFATVFVLLGAVGNGATIAYLGYLMEISPDDRRPAYSGYFNALTAPAALLPLVGAAIVEAASYATVFAASSVAAALQVLAVRRLRTAPMGDDEQ